MGGLPSGVDHLFHLLRPDLVPHSLDELLMFLLAVRLRLKPKVQKLGGCR